MSDRRISAIFRERPLSSDFKFYEVREGMSIAEIISEAQLPSYFEQHGIVIIGDEEVPQWQGPLNLWKAIKPKPRADGSITVQFGIKLGKGGGGGGSSSSGGSHKSTVSLIATIAIFAATIWIGGGGLVAAGLAESGGTFAAGGLGAGLLAGAVSIGGSLAIAGLTRPPSVSPNQTVADTSTDAGDATTTQQGASSISGNTLGPGDPVPRVFGTHDITPPLLGQVIQEIIGLDEYSEAVFGLAGPHSITNIRVNDVPIDTIPNLSYQVVEGLPDDEVQSLVTRQGYTLQPSITISRPQNDPTNTQNVLNQVTPALSLPSWHGFVSRKAPDELWVVLNWHSALVDTTSPTTQMAVPVRMRFRRKGSTAWTNLPEFHFNSKSGQPFLKRFKFIWRVKPLAYPMAPTDEGPYIALANVPAQTQSPPSGGWTADPYFWTAGVSYYSAATYGSHTIQGIELNSDGVDISLDPTSFPQDFYEFQTIIGNVYTQSTFSQNSNYTQSGTVFDFFGFSYSGITAIFNRTRQGIQDAVELARVVSIWNELPILRNVFATLSLRVKNIAISKVTIEAAGYTRDWNGTEWADLITTSNPAPHWVDCMTNLIALPIPMDLLDNNSLVAWRQSCTDNNFQCNAVFTGKMLEDVADTIAGSGYARTRRSELWGVILDKDRSAEGPRQTFTPRNLTSFYFEKAFPVVPTGLRVSFDDIFDNYNEREIVVLRPGVQDDGAYQKIRYDTYVTEAEATQRALFDLGQITERPVLYRGNSPLQWLSCTKGDLVAIGHDILDYQAGFAYINQVIVDASTPPKIIGFTLDGTIPISGDDQWSDSGSMWSSYTDQWQAPRYGILIRCRDQTTRTVEIVATENPFSAPVESVQLKVAMTDPGSSVIAVGCMISSGTLGREYIRMLVLDITPKDNFTADMTFVDEAPQLFSMGVPI